MVSHPFETSDEKTAIWLVNRIIETGRLEFDEPRAAGVTVLQAIEGFLAEQTSRGMADSTLKSFRKFLIGSPNRANCRNPEKFSPTLMEFAIDQAIETLQAFVAEPDLVAKFRQRWQVSQTSREGAVFHVTAHRVPRAGSCLPLLLQSEAQDYPSHLQAASGIFTKALGGERNTDPRPVGVVKSVPYFR